MANKKKKNLAIIELGDIKIDSENYKVTKKGKKIKLTKTNRTRAQ